MSLSTSRRAPRRGSRWPTRRAAVTTLLIVVLAPVLLVALAGCGGATPGDDAASADVTAHGDGDAILAAAFKDRLHDLQVQGRGTVVRLLADDADGVRHQRFIIRLESGQTLLVAHNIDIAPRVEGLAVGDDVSFSGVYEWSAEGGAVHWTHHDPDGRHAPGWLRHDGTTYQ